MNDYRISERIRRQAAMASRAGQMAKLEDIAADVEALETENAKQAERIAIYQDTLTARRDVEIERLRAVVEAATEFVDARLAGHSVREGTAWTELVKAVGVALALDISGNMGVLAADGERVRQSLADLPEHQQRDTEALRERYGVAGAAPEDDQTWDDYMRGEGHDLFTAEAAGLQLVGYLNPSSGILHRAKLGLSVGPDWEPVYVRA